MESAPSYNRDVRDIIRIDPRVSLDREDTATGGSGVDRISCLGSNDRGNAFTVDGIPQGDIYGLNDTGFSSRSSTPVPYDAVRETQVQFAPYDVEYGNFTGCAINVVTKSGSNRFHGGAFYEFSSKTWRGDELPGRPVGGVDDDKRWGVNFGGPIIKDRLFFFGAYENQKGGFAQDEGPDGGDFANPISGISVDQFNAISEVLRDVYGIDTGPLVTIRPFSNERYFGRLDWQITDDHRLEATYQRLEESTIRSDEFFTGSSPADHRPQLLLRERDEVQLLFGAASTRAGTTFFRRNSAIPSPTSRTSRIRSAAVKPSPPIRSRASSSALTIHHWERAPARRSLTASSRPDQARTARPTTSRPSCISIRAVGNADTGAHKFKLGFDSTRRSSTICLSTTRLAPWFSATSRTWRPGCCRPAPATTIPAPSRTTSSRARRKARSAISRPTGDSLTPRPLQADDLFARSCRTTGASTTG